MKFSIILLFLSICLTKEISSDRSFSIDYANNQFLKDGVPFRYISGSLHYFKVPSVLWRDRMVKFKLAGLNAVQTYIEWNSHEPEKGVYDFSGDNNITEFLQIALELDLVVILRTGPFIDAERDMGGFPYWLLRENSQMALRTSDPSYISEVDRWFSVLLPIFVPMLYKNGGPVIMVQVENEYGSYYACDYAYNAHLRNLHQQILGSDVVLFTCDGAGDSMLKCGRIDGVYTTIDFGAGDDVVAGFHAQRNHQQFGPLINSEFYAGWLDFWERPFALVDKDDVCRTLDEMLSLNASFNIYMFHGGTNFGFTSGTLDTVGAFLACLTSYDYDAPLTEAGDPTQKYFAMRDVIAKYVDLPDDTLPTVAPKMELPKILLTPIANIFDNDFTQTPIESIYPLTFEQLSQRHGFVLYSTTINFQPSDPAVLTVEGLADRAQVFVDGKYSGTLSRTQEIYKLGLNINDGSRLDLFVENQGRICYGSHINELKGITQNVTLGPVILKNWKHYNFFSNWTQAIDSIQSKFNRKSTPPQILADSSLASDRIPIFFGANFTLPTTYLCSPPLDTYLRLDGWRKGVAFLNGFNLGRYWPVSGPQVTLYTPAHLFKLNREINTLIVFELEGYPIDSTVQFVKTHVLNGTIPVDSDELEIKLFHL